MLAACVTAGVLKLSAVAARSAQILTWFEPPQIGVRSGRLQGQLAAAKA